jgi:hypothetical protein
MALGSGVGKRHCEALLPPLHKAFTMLTQILTRIPVWVLPLFFGLMLLGWMQTRPRQLSRRRLVALPFSMGVFSLFSVMALFGAAVHSLLPWAIGLALGSGLALAMCSREGMRFDAVKQEFNMPGSALPWALIMGIFSLRFVVGALSATGSFLLQDTVVVALCCLLAGGLSGGFLGRALALWKTQTQFRLAATAGSLPHPLRT